MFYLLLQTAVPAQASTSDAAHVAVAIDVHNIYIYIVGHEPDGDGSRRPQFVNCKLNERPVVRPWRTRAVVYRLVGC